MEVRIGAAGPKGQGVFAVRSFRRGATVIVGRAIARSSERSRMSVQIDWVEHVELDLPGTLLNHSCEPNLGVRRNGFSAYDFVALRGIAAGEEVTFDYAMTEYQLVRPLACYCERSSCVGMIRGWREREPEWHQLNAAHSARYLLGTAVRRSRATG